MDLGSLNGTFVNGVQVIQETLKPGDRIQIGESTLVFSEVEPAILTAQPITAPEAASLELEAPRSVPLQTILERIKNNTELAERFVPRVCTAGIEVACRLPAAADIDTFCQQVDNNPFFPLSIELPYLSPEVEEEPLEELAPIGLYPSGEARSIGERVRKAKNVLRVDMEDALDVIDPGHSVAIEDGALQPFSSSVLIFAIRL